MIIRCHFSNNLVTMRSLLEEPTLETARIFKALDHDVRYQIVSEILSKEKMSFTELSKLIDATRTSLAYHLQILVNSGLLEKTLERNGVEYSFYSITDLALILFSQLQLLKESRV